MRWVNQEALPHTVTADDGSWNSGTLSQGGVYTRQFANAGVYRYHCVFHGGPGVGMAGTILVLP